MDIDKLGEKIEKLSDKVKSLNYKFADESLEEEANEAKNDCVAALENWLELVTKDSEEKEEAEDEDEEDK